MNLVSKITICVLNVLLALMMIALGGVVFATWQERSSVASDPVSPFLLWLGAILVFLNTIIVIKYKSSPLRNQLKNLQLENEIMRQQLEKIELQKKLEGKE